MNQSTYYIPKKISINDLNINAVGIDLGTSRCCAAVNRRNGIETISLDNTGERLLPSFVFYTKLNGKCGQVAVDQLQNSPKSIVFDCKRIIGKNYSEVTIDPVWPFEVLNFGNTPLLRVQEEKEIAALWPVAIAAVLLNHIKEKAEEFQGKKLDEVVITVPAAFSENQKVATMQAGKLAGWKTVHLLPEPVAASIAYFVDRPIPNKFNMLLFDFGGGTLDVCIFKIDNDSLKIINQCGDNSIGGRDFDNILFKHFSSIIKKEYNIDVNIKDKLKYRLLEKCIKIKHTLTIEKETVLDINDFNPSVDYVINISRQNFEEMSSLFFNKVKEVIIKALSNANYTSRDINKVLLVGGSSRMPMVKHFLHDMFTRAEHCCEENPDEVVAIGAAYYAYHHKSNMATSLNFTSEKPIIKEEKDFDAQSRNSGITSHKGFWAHLRWSLIIFLRRSK